MALKSGSKRVGVSSICLGNVIADESMIYSRLEPKRPTVERIGDKVKKCFFYKGTGQCLGARCYWPMVGTCSTFNRLKSRGKFAK